MEVCEAGRPGSGMQEASKMRPVGCVVRVNVQLADHTFVAVNSTGTTVSQSTSATTPGKQVSMVR